MRRLLKYAVLMALVALPIMSDYILLQFQIDPFVSDTTTMANLLSAFGSTGASSAYLHGAAGFSVPGWAWQPETVELLNFFPGSGFLLASLHLVTGAPVVPLSYVPVSYVVVILGMVLLARNAWKVAESSHSIRKVIFVSIVALSIYSAISSNIIGRFYGLEYHGLNLALFVIFCAILLKAISEDKMRTFIGPLVILFGSMLTIHQTEPTLIIGGLASYLLVLFVLNLLGSKNRRQVYQIATLFVPVMMLGTLQSFYYLVLGGLNFSYISQRLTEYLTGAAAPISLGATTSGVLPMFDLLLEKGYAWGMLGVVILVSTYYLAAGRSRREDTRKGAQFFFFAIMIGASVAYSLSYFAYYGGISFGFVYPWLLQIFVLISVALTRSANRSFNKLVAILIVSLAFLAAVNAATSTVTLSFYAQQGPFVSTIGIESSQALPFVVTRSGTQETVGASIGASSYMYRELADYPLTSYTLDTIVPLSGYIPFYSETGVLGTYSEMHGSLNLFVITAYESKNGLYGDVSSTYGGTSAYLNVSQVADLLAVIELHSARIYSSTGVSLYYFPSG